jgi:hypothetical protein
LIARGLPSSTKDGGRRFELAFIVAVGAYRRAIEAAGFAILHERDHREVACNLFRCERPRWTSGDARHPPSRDDPQETLQNVVDLFRSRLLSARPSCSAAPSRLLRSHLATSTTSFL